MAVRVTATGQHYTRTTGAWPTAWPITLSLWALLDTDRNTSVCLWVMGNSTTSPTEYLILYNANSDGTTMSVEEAGGVLVGSVNMVAGTWYVFTYTKAGTGSSQAILYSAAATASALTVTTGFHNRATFTPLSEYFLSNIFAASTAWVNGRIAHVKRWSAVLTQTEIEREWRSGPPVRWSNLAA